MSKAEVLNHQHAGQMWLVEPWNPAPGVPPGQQFGGRGVVAINTVTLPTARFPNPKPYMSGQSRAVPTFCHGATPQEFACLGPNYASPSGAVLGLGCSPPPSTWLGGAHCAHTRCQIGITGWVQLMDGQGTAHLTCGGKRLSTTGLYYCSMLLSCTPG